MVSENVTSDVMYNLTYHVIHNVTDDSQTTFPEDLSQQPYPYPLEFKPVWEVAVKTLLYVPVIVFAIIGNVVVILVVVKNKRMQTTTNYYIVNLAVADCLVALACSWPHLVDDLTPFWILGAFFCTLNTFSQVLALVASMFTLTCIACDRFFGIVFAMKAHFIERRASFTIILIWLLSVAVASPLLYYRRLSQEHWKDVTESWCDDAWPLSYSVDPETNDVISHSTPRRFYYMFVCVALFFVPCLAMSVAYLVIIVTLWSAQVPGERISKDIKSQTKMRKRIILMLVVILAVFFLCWSPLTISLIYSEFIHGRQTKMDDWYHHFQYFARYLAHFNSLINPVIYAGFNDNFKKGFQNLCRGGERRTRYNTMVSRADSFQSSTHITKV
ncbi:QRFP-like peptide receptor [Physella acuta]|uniref:QRFP-like peptide receptor n=1 Tax=Physella acuta TaxID=109671 RepID=UPI0027DE0245|nr:QRFP-like peptide receptor [Physella acuta]